jgi:hypothetical protein
LVQLPRLGMARGRGRERSLHPHLLRDVLLGKVGEQRGREKCGEEAAKPALFTDRVALLCVFQRLPQRTVCDDEAKIDYVQPRWDPIAGDDERIAVCWLWDLFDDAIRGEGLVGGSRGRAKIGAGGGGGAARDCV